MSEIIRRIGNHPFFTGSVRFNTNKGQNLNSAAKLLMFEVSGIQETKKINLDKFANQYTESSKEVEAGLPMVFETLELMSETFQFHDPLLQSEGPVHIYYWLTRNAEDEEIPYIRDFLEEFSDTIKSTQPPKGKSQIISAESWLSYKNASRSVNDRTSHELRYQILRQSFDKWLSLRT